MFHIRGGFYLAAAIVILAIFFVYGFLTINEFNETNRAYMADSTARMARHELELMRLERTTAAVFKAAEKRAAFIMRSDQIRAAVDAVRLAANDEFTPSIIFKMIWMESRWNPNAVGEQGEIGLLQIKPHIAAIHGYSRADLFDPAKNIAAAVKELNRLRVVMGSVPLAIAAYAGGPTRALYYARDITAE